MEKLIKWHQELNDKVVSSYFIEEQRYGLIQVSFNTHNKWIGFNRSSDKLYQFYDSTSGMEIRSNIEIPNFELTRYICYEMQDKDQITFLYIPFEVFMSDKMINHQRERLLKKDKLTEKETSWLKRLNGIVYYAANEVKKAFDKLKKEET